MLQYSEGDIILICGALYDKMLIGYVIEKQSTPVKYGENVECCLVETKNLDPESIRYFPQGNRKYQIYHWNIFGMEVTKNNDSNEYDSEDIHKIIKAKDDIIARNINISAVGIGMAKHDFNINATEEPIDTNIFEDEIQHLLDSESSFINFLSLSKGDMLIITIIPNKYGWFEAYKASDEFNSLGICHIDFIYLAQF